MGLLFIAVGAFAATPDTQQVLRAIKGNLLEGVFNGYTKDEACIVNITYAGNRRGKKDLGVHMMAFLRRDLDRNGKIAKEKLTQFNFQMSDKATSLKGTPVLTGPEFKLEVKHVKDKEEINQTFILNRDPIDGTWLNMRIDESDRNASKTMTCELVR